MIRTLQNHGAVLLLVSFVGLSAVMVYSVVVLIDQVAGSVKIFTLALDSQEHSATIQAEVVSLEKRLATLSSLKEHQQERRPLSLSSIEGCARQNRLGIGAVERLSSGSKNGETSGVRYSVSIIGTIGNMVRFLDQLEKECVIESDNITIRPDNADGTQVVSVMNVILNE